jgi:hypothetical protein
LFVNFSNAQREFCRIVIRKISNKETNKGASSEGKNQKQHTTNNNKRPQQPLKTTTNTSNGPESKPTSPTKQKKNETPTISKKG